MKIVSLSRCWTRAQVVKTGVVDQMTMCQADGLDTTEYCTHVNIFEVLHSTECFHGSLMPSHLRLKHLQ